MSRALKTKKINDKNKKNISKCLVKPQDMKSAICFSSRTVLV